MGLRPDRSGSAALFWAGKSYRMARNNWFAYMRYNRCPWDLPSSQAAKYARDRLALPETLAQFEAYRRSLQEPDNNSPASADPASAGRRLAS